MKNLKLLNAVLTVFLTAAVFLSPSYAQEEDEWDEPAETETLVINSQNKHGTADYIYVQGEEDPGVDVTADGESVTAEVAGDIYAGFGGVSVLTENGGSAVLDLGSVRGGYGFMTMMNTGSVTADTGSITAADGSGFEAYTSGASSIVLNAADISSLSDGVLVKTSTGSGNISYDGDFIDPEIPEDGEWEDFEYDKWYDVPGEEQNGSQSGDTTESVSGGAQVTIALGSIDAGGNGAGIEISKNDSVTLTAEDYIAAGGTGVDVSLYGEGGTADITSPVIDAGDRGLSIYAADGTVKAAAGDYISADSAAEITNDGADITLEAGYLEGDSGLYIEAADGTTTAQTKDITAGNYGIYVWTYDQDAYEEYDPEAEGQESSGTQESTSGSPEITVTADGDITDYLDYQPEDSEWDIIDPVDPEEPDRISKAADEEGESDDETGSVGIIVEAETKSMIDITVNGVIEMAYGNEIEVFDESEVKVSVGDDVTTDYGNRIASYDGSTVTFDFGGGINAGGKALDTAAYSGSLDITVKGDINVQEGNDDEETAGIWANSAGTGKTDISVDGGITVTSGNDAPVYGISLLNTGGEINVKTAKDVSAEGTDAAGLEIINDPENDLAYTEDGSEPILTNVEITGSLSGKDTGLIYDTAEDPDNAKAVILVTDTISGGVIVSEDASSDNFDLAVWKIDKSQTGGNAAVTPDNKPSEIEPDIKYIIKIRPEDEDKIKAVDENGALLPLTNGPVTGDPYPYMKEGEKVFLEGINGYELTEAYNGKETQTALPKDENGRFYLDVPKGGAVWLAAEKAPAPEPQPEQQPNEMNFYRLGELSLLDGRELPHTGFSPSHRTQLPARPRGTVYRPTGMTLQIPGLNIAEEIVKVPKADGGYPVEWLGSSIGMLEGSSLPGRGITVLTGHNHLNTTEAGPFVLIRTLNEGDRIMITGARQDTQIYRVSGNYKIASDGFAEVAPEITQNALVLITCEDESAGGGYISRRVVLAEPIQPGQDQP